MSQDTVHADKQRMGKWEFVALIAMLFSTIAFSVDALLPAFPQIERDLGAASQGRLHLLITVFMGGLAFGTLVAGPLSDAMGRRATMFLGAALYLISGVVAWLSNSFEVIVAARLVQGIGAAGPRVVSMAIVRDLYSGRAMAQIISFAMVLFTLVPTLAPAMGHWLTGWFGWRAILLAFLLFSAISTLWFWARLDETLAKERRKPFRLSQFKAAGREVLGHPVVRLAILVQSVSLGLIFCMIVSVQPIYDLVYGRGDSFPYWFGGVALFSAASTSVANAALVMRFGMRRLATLGMAGQAISAAVVFALLQLFPQYGFASFLLFQFLLIWLTGLCIGNLNALALEPMGHIAGFATSLTGAISTLLAAAVATLVGALFNETPEPLVLSSAFLGCVGLALMLRLNAHAAKAE